GRTGRVVRASRRPRGIPIPARARAFAEPLRVGLTRSDEHHPLMERALSDAQRFDARWYAGLRELREWYKQDTKAVRDMFCNIPESPGDYAEGDAYAAKLQQIADRMRDRLAPKW